MSMRQLTTKSPICTTLQYLTLGQQFSERPAIPPLFLMRYPFSEVLECGVKQ